MSKSILVTGGARSGKSVIAENLIRDLGAEAIYIATAEAGDGEMATRIAAHRARRGVGWRTVEAPRDLVEAIRRTDGAAPRLIDCLTLWLSNLMLAEEDWHAEAGRLVAAIGERTSPMVLVTNEVGAGIVPENALSRRFRDAAGQLNQMVAAEVDEVYFAVAGLPLRVKPHG